MSSNENLMTHLSKLYLVTEEPKQTSRLSPSLNLNPAPTTTTTTTTVASLNTYIRTVKSPIKFHIDIDVNGIIATNSISMADMKLVASLLQNSKSTSLRGAPKQIMTYTVETTVLNCINNNNNNTSVNLAQVEDKYKQIRRYNDFLGLQSQLLMEFPSSVIPIVTPKDFDSLNLSVAESRRRQLRMWLQYITHHSSFQTSKSLKSFVTENKTPPLYWRTNDAYRPELQAQDSYSVFSAVRAGSSIQPAGCSMYVDSNSKFKCMKEKKLVTR